jgi:membrane associated rhomboid family serine protease
MLIPLGHEQTSVRRLPWVTFTVMGLCLVIFILMAPTEHRNEMESFLKLQQALGYYTQHPYLEMVPRFRSIFVNELGEDQAVMFAEHMRLAGPEAPTDRAQLEAEQDRFNSVVDAYFSVIDGSLLSRFGLVPASFKTSHLVTYQFLHVGWLHLVFNLLMLFVVGPFVEDVWGRPIFAAFYLAAGAAAGLMFAIRYPDLQMPLVGASGAIAGVMGAFLVRYVRSKIRFVVWLGVPVGPFSAPAWVIFPMWFAIQIFSAQSLERQLPEGGGVAFWAHVWGFVFGVVFAAAMAQLRVEQRYLDKAIESKVTMLDNTAVDQAIGQARAGDLDGGVKALETELKKHPDNVDAVIALWNLCSTSGDAARAGPAMAKVIENAVRSGDNELILAHWDDILVHHPEIAIDPLLAVRLAEILDGEQRVVSAVETLELGHSRIGESTPMPVLLRMAKLALMIEAPSAGSIVQAALNHPELPPSARPELEVALWGLARQASDREIALRGAAETDEPVVADERPADETPEGSFALYVTEAVPMDLSNNLLTVDVAGILQEIDLHSLQAVGVGVVARENGKSVALMDLLLDPPGMAKKSVRTFRVFSDRFDPRAFFSSGDALTAFRSMLAYVLDVSLASPLPDWESARGQPFKSFRSIAEYERSVLGITD